MTNPVDERLALPVEQGVLLWCMRTWVAGMRQEGGLDGRIGRMLSALGAPGVTPYLEGLMFAVGHGAARTVAVQCVCCPVVSADERLLLDAMGLAQEHRPFEALLLLRSMLSAEGARAALGSAEGVGTALARVGLFLPAPDGPMCQMAYPAAGDGPARAANRDADRAVDPGPAG